MLEDPDRRFLYCAARGRRLHEDDLRLVIEIGLNHRGVAAHVQITGKEVLDLPIDDELVAASVVDPGPEKVTDMIDRHAAEDHLEVAIEIEVHGLG